MDQPLNPALQIARLQAKLDQVEKSHRAEIERLRGEMQGLLERLAPDGTEPAAQARETRVPVSVPPPPPERIPAPPPLPPRMPAKVAAVAWPETASAGAPEAAAVGAKPPESAGVAPVGAPPAAAAERDSIELNIGRVWLVRIGIILLVTGLVLLGNYAYRNWIRELPAIVRLGFLVAASAAVAGAGWWCTLRERLRAFGEVVLAGGMGLFYWCAYAAHHVSRLQVIESPLLSTATLLVAAAAIIGVSVRRDARTTAVMGILLASYSMVLQPMGPLSAVANLLLAATGVVLVWRRGWEGPGLAAMAGSYGAFFWWYFAGAAGGGVVPSVLGFLAGTWAIFVVPGVLRSRGADRYRAAWFDGLNNVAFFALFSLCWWALGYAGYWRVPAVFGAVLVGLGAFLRGRSRSADTHLVQGFVALSAALVLKLEGYHLAFGLALESLVMAGAFLRFRRAPELAFSVLSALGALGWALVRTDLPVWSTGVTALLLAGTTAVLRLGSDRGGRWSAPARQLTGVVMAAAGLVALFAWCLRLPESYRGEVVAALAFGLAATVRLLDRGRWMPELAAPALGFSVAALVLVVWDFTALGLAGCGAIALIAAGSALIGERAGPGRGSTAPPWHEGVLPLTTWVHALTVPLALWFLLESWQPGADVRLLSLSLGAAGLATLAGRAMGCPKLRLGIELLLLGGLVELARRTEGGSLLAFLPAVAGGAARFAARSTGDEREEGFHRILTRCVALAGWIGAWIQVLPDAWPEVVALSALAALLAGRGWWPQARPIEAVVCGGLALAMFAGAMLELPWTGRGGIPDGWGLVLAAVVAAFLPLGDGQLGRRIGKGMLWLASAALGLWSTRWLVGELGWQAAAILWSGLGFTLVSVGLWRRLAPLRHAGFLVLALALGKLFLADVWDFGTFFRVVAFLALGVALVVLGFFYNRFAELIKRLMESDEARAEPPGGESS